jgi:transcriptional regulator with XRE-family HTH domain
LPNGILARRKYMSIGDVIASARRRKRIDQKTMAKDLDISPSYLSQVENNSRTPSAKLLKQIAVQLDIPVSALLFEVIQDTDFNNEEDRQLFLKAKPLMDKMIAVLLSEDSNKPK